MINIVRVDGIINNIYRQETTSSRKEKYLDLFKKIVPASLAINIIEYEYLDFSLDPYELEIFLANHNSDEVKNELLQAYSKVCSYLNYDTDIYLLVLPLTQSNIFYNTQMNGIVAHTIGKNTIVFYINFKNTNSYLKIRSLFIHEYQHIISSRLTNKNTLMDKIIDEGRSELLVKETIGCEYVGSWATKLSNEHIVEYMPLVSIYKNSIDDNILYDFLNGSCEYKIPLWFGYSFGYRVVCNYRQYNTNLDFLNFIKVKSEVVYNKFIGENKW